MLSPWLVLSVLHKSPGVVINVQAIMHRILVEFAVDEVFEFHPKSMLEFSGVKRGYW